MDAERAVHLDTEQAVTLVPSRYEEWVRRFAQMAAVIEPIVPDATIEHIGSTAVPDQPAKDVVDLLIGVDAQSVVPAARRLVAAGFDLEGELDHHCWLSSPDRRDRAFVLHVVEHGSRAWNRRMAFRDLLRADESARRAYLQVKEHAARQSRGWDDYTLAKSSVVAELLAGADAED
ncbi:GrpB family protein [Georgenia sp. MJ170]|uniref:GrpB family protein n=1 Tax=Georgenia sunbinii TaxID=3117728 RepID=UPI002F26BBDD